MGTQYDLYVVNDSPDEVLDFCLYQKPPDVAMPKVQSLAWLVKTAHPGTTLHFTWTIDYSVLWAQSGILQPGVLFDASQIIPADLAYNNQVVFDYTEGAFLFDPKATISGISAEQGTLYVQCSPNIPPNEASVSIGMSGAAVAGVQADPGMLATFTPHPTYWLAAGDYTQGLVVDIEDITNSYPVEFPDDVFVMTAVLDGANRWTVAPGKPTAVAVAAG
jgi:hypothetical protein